MTYAYRQNTNTGEIHRAIEGRFTEECNTDQIEDDESIAEEEALRLLAEMPDKACGHCWPQEKGETE